MKNISVYFSYNIINHLAYNISIEFIRMTSRAI